MNKIIALIGRALGPLARESRRDDGVIGLIIVIALLAGAASLIASTVRQNKDAEIRRLSGNATSVKLLKNSVVAYFLTDPDGAGAIERNGRIPCPDTNVPPDGQANINGTDCVLTDGTATGGTTLAYTGVVPWLTMGLSESEAIDTYGNYFTYAVTSSATSRAICASVTNAYSSALVEYTGTLNDVTDTEVRLSSQSAGQGAPYYYSLISHGKNGLGAISSSGTLRSAPASTTENQNCSTTNTNCTSNDALVLISGPKDTTSSTYFDDNIYLGSNSQLTELCESLTPAGQPGADVSEEFTNTATGSLPPRIAAVTGTAAVEQSTVTGNTTDRVLRFTGANSSIRTASTSLNTAERARYVSFEWRPTTLGTGSTAGISVALRATAADRGASTGGGAGTFNADIFNTGTSDGLTVRFFDDVVTNADGAVLNRIYICDNVSANCDNTGGSGGGGGTNNLASSDADTFLISNNTAYTVEVYDDGVQIWARITQIGTPANTAFVSLASIAALSQQDFADTNGFLAINYSDATVEIDDVLVGRGSMGVAFDGANDIVSAGDNHNTTTGNLTLEAWIRPDTLPSGANLAVLISKWTEGGANTVQSYRLYLTAGGALTLQLAGNPGTGSVLETHSFGGYSARAGRWDHIAVTYNGTGGTDRSAKLYLNRELIARSASTTFATNGVQSATAAFSIGNDVAATVATAFDGDITDVRVWNTTRTAQEVFANYNRRIQLSGTATGLIVNWTLDRDTTATTLPTFSTTSALPTAAAAGATGTLASGAAYVAISQRHIPVFATAAICAAGGAQGAVAGAFQCDYQLAAQSSAISIPNNLAYIHVKAWGGGGGAYDQSTNDSTGGGGGFSAGRLYAINTTPVAGRIDVRVDVGGGGTASTSVANNGAGGGGVSGIWRDVDVDNALDPGTEFAGMIGGGGGGASSGDDNQSAASGPNCDTVGNCGPGGGGGGPSNILSGVSTTRAPDASSALCGGRGADNTPSGANPSNASYCDAGGVDPTTTTGATGGGTATGGTSVIGSGGAGHNGSEGGGNDSIGGGGAGGGVRLVAMTAGGGESGGYDENAGGIETDSDTPDDNGSGFGGGGGGGFADTAAIGVAGAAARFGITTGNNAAAGGVTDPDYAGNAERVVTGSFTLVAYCAASGTPCTNTPGRGGKSGSATLQAGKPGAVIIKW